MFTIAFVLALPASVIHIQDNRNKSLMQIEPRVYVPEKNQSVIPKYYNTNRTTPRKI